MDLIDSRRVRGGENEITLTGFCSLDSSTLAPDHRPARVIYRIERDDNGSRLIRRQETLDVLGNHNAWSELVCQDVAKIRLSALPASSPPTTTRGADIFGAADGNEVVACYRLVVSRTNEADGRVDQVLCVR